MNGSRKTPMNPGRALRMAAKRHAVVRANHFSTFADMVAADELLYRKAREFVRAEDARRAKKALLSQGRDEVAPNSPDISGPSREEK